MIDKPKGIIDPPLDDLLERVDNKYQLVIFASKRARQINDYYTDLQDGAIYNNVGPLVDSNVDDKPLSIALREINEGKLSMHEPREEAIILEDDDAEDLLDFGEDTVSPAEAE
ncbi:DNA-directed RNA polymerase subunit omega [Gulosibacter chungangensis]|uniref:DNA-directed RNA polymerase subunit omega n=1 Tax=Gulosibacter chungangensis TaxID=979746 RepID=A0A7J5BD53_9MICO|nr:DNA-directed RNA polymerase subunit omega [Gulosibacter chungangensis]KAB1644079.1 DNA-directed RNA polymerase subunit omega [Gulosibacter chungangensis]